MYINFIFYSLVILIAFGYYIFGFFQLGRDFTNAKGFLFANFSLIKKKAFILSAIFFFVANFFGLLFLFSNYASAEVTHPTVLNLFKRIDALLEEQISSENFNKVHTTHREYPLCFKDNVFTEEFRQIVDDFAWLASEVCPSPVCPDVCPLEQKIVLKIHDLCIQELFIKPNFHLYGENFTCDLSKVFIDKTETVRFVHFTCFFDLMHMLECQEYNFRKLCLDPIIAYDLQAKKFCELVKHSWVLNFLSHNLPLTHRSYAHLLLNESLEMVFIFENCHQHLCGFIYDSIDASKSFYYTRGHLSLEESRAFKNEAISLLPSHGKNPPQAMSLALRGTSFPFFTKSGVRTLCDSHYEGLAPPSINDVSSGSSSSIDWSKTFGDVPL